MEKSSQTKIIRCDNINPDDVWGDNQKVIEIIGLGSGDGFRLENANLPKGWDENLGKIKNIDPTRAADFYQQTCQESGYDLEKVVFDNNNILAELIIKHKASGDESKLSLLDSNFMQQENGEYATKNISRIGAAVIFQCIISKYLDYGWQSKDFKYGVINYSPEHVQSGYGPIGLEIPADIFNQDGEITDVYEQRYFIDRANNIAGRFGVDLQEAIFNERGILHGVGVSGDRTSYQLNEGERKYNSHNVDRADQAAALHGIVALHINNLLDKKYMNQGR